MNMINMLWCRFQQCLATFTILLVEGSSQTGLFRHSCNHFVGVLNFGNGKAIRVIFFFKPLKFNLDFKNVAENREKSFCFWNKCISIRIIKLSLLRIWYLSYAANVLTSSPRFCMSIRETFSNSIDLAVINESDKGDVMHIWTVLGHLPHVASRSFLWNGTF